MKQTFSAVKSVFRSFYRLASPHLPLLSPRIIANLLPLIPPPMLLLHQRLQFVNQYLAPVALKPCLPPHSMRMESGRTRTRSLIQGFRSQ